MALRLILVSAVAGLGFGLPSGDRLQTWGDSTRCWVHARLAEWDAEMPADAAAFVLVAEPSADTAQLAPTPAPVEPAALATSTTTARTKDVAAPAPNPIASAPFGLTELAAGLDIPTIPMDLETPEIVTAAPAVTVDDSAFNTAQGAVLAAFAADARAVALAKPVVTPSFEPIEPGDDLYQGIAYALNREAEGLHPSESLAPRFEPLDPGPDLYQGIAYALNREAEGLGLAAPSNATSESSVIQELESPARRGRLAQAVRLTREAAHAWASLLHGPAVVILSR